VVKLFNIKFIKTDLQMYKFSFIDLFAGIGGFRIALQSIGGKCLFSCEINEHCQKMYQENFGEIPAGDIKTIDPNDIPECDVLCAGFPCQPFSISGKKMGLKDERASVIESIFNIVNHSKPKVVMLENVKHLLHHNNGETLQHIVSNLNKIGYNISYNILNAKNFGVPQNRERLIIIASLNGKFDFSKLKKQKTIKIHDILDQEGDFEFLESDEYKIIENPTRQQSGLIFSGYRNKKIRNKGVREGTEHLSRVHKQPNRIYSIEGTHPTLSSQETSGRYWILLNNGRVRKLTINECFKIMGFPEDYKLKSSISELYKQVGNSVCIPKVRIIGEAIVEQLL
jgi:DNA (cytosine-5)-methyltransferase 1